MPLGKGQQKKRENEWSRMGEGKGGTVWISDQNSQKSGKQRVGKCKKTGDYRLFKRKSKWERSSQKGSARCGLLEKKKGGGGAPIGFTGRSRRKFDSTSEEFFSSKMYCWGGGGRREKNNDKGLRTGISCRVQPPPPETLQGLGFS